MLVTQGIPSKLGELVRIHSMKLYVIVFLSTLAIGVKAGLSREEAHEAFRAVAHGCMTSSGATDADIDELILHHPASSMEAKCMRACLMKKFDIMSPDGRFVKDIAMKIADIHTKGDPVKMQVAEEVTEVCKDIAVSDNHCEAADQYGNCAISEAVKRGITSVDF